MDEEERREADRSEETWMAIAMTQEEGKGRDGGMILTCTVISTQLLCSS